MKKISDLEELYREQGDALYSLAFELGGSKERAEELLIMADDDFLDTSIRACGRERRYLFMKGKLEKYSGKTVVTYKRQQIPPDVYERMISSAKIFEGHGGRVRSRIIGYIVLGLILLVISLVALRALDFVVSDEHDEAIADYFFGAEDTEDE
ncbi:MAG: hypothetical protein IKO44_01420 [Ruminococcus sp.]|nr:hypothetical protein [Ruminococcus sp.]